MNSTQKARRKPRGTCVLKNLGTNQQASLFEYMDGIGDARGHTYKQCVAWLAQQNIVTNKTQLSRWRDWYLQRMVFQWCCDTVERMMENDLGEPKMSDEEVQCKGNRMFSLLAVQTRDDKAWSRAQTSMVRRQRLTLIERRFELEIKKYEDQRAQARQVESEPEMTREEKQARIRQIMGTE